MLAFFLSLATMWMVPTGFPVAPVPAAEAAAEQVDPTGHPGFGWLDGTWKFNGLEMVCAAKGYETTCDEVGKSGPMQGAAAKLTFTPASSKIAGRLTLALPNMPAATFTEIASGAQSSTFETKTASGVAQLRFSRSGDALKVERGSGDAWGQAMVYTRG